MKATEMTLREMAEVIKGRWREKSPGGCRMLSEGEDCDCTLCLVGNLHTATIIPSSDAAPVAWRYKAKDAPEGPSDEAKLAFIKAHTNVMGEWEVTDGWEKALDAGLRAFLAHAPPSTNPGELTVEMVEAGVHGRFGGGFTYGDRYEAVRVISRRVLDAAHTKTKQEG